jgi:hypothetical protein
MPHCTACVRTVVWYWWPLHISRATQLSLSLYTTPLRIYPIFLLLLAPYTSLSILLYGHIYGSICRWDKNPSVTQIDVSQWILTLKGQSIAHLAASDWAEVMVATIVCLQSSPTTYSPVCQLYAAIRHTYTKTH